MVGGLSRRLLHAAFGAGAALLISAAAFTYSPARLDSYLKVHSSDDVSIARIEIRRKLFGTAVIPSTLPVRTETIELPFYPGIGATKLTLSNRGQYAYLLKPANRNGALVIYHAGHDGPALFEGGDTIRHLLWAGYDVLAISMPPGQHDQLPLRAFMEPIAEAVNYTLGETKYRTVQMIGLSGGGWSTVLYAALDPRVECSYPIAGSLPEFLSREGDAEQRLPDLDVGYLDLYLLASTDGREQVQHFNRDDPCCFAGDQSNAYRDFMSSKANGLGGNFSTVTVDFHQHAISPETVKRIFGAPGIKPTGQCAIKAPYSIAHR